MGAIDETEDVPIFSKLDFVQFSYRFIENFHFIVRQNIPINKTQIPNSINFISLNHQIVNSRKIPQIKSNRLRLNSKCLAINSKCLQDWQIGG